MNRPAFGISRIARNFRRQRPVPLSPQETAMRTRPVAILLTLVATAVAAPGAAVAGADDG
jgi:hypothetical protein